MSYDDELKAVRELRGMGATVVTVGAVSATFAPLQVVEAAVPDRPETPEEYQKRVDAVMFHSAGG